MRIAVIGTGIAGLSAAWLLSRKHEVVLFEKDARPGGHTNTVLTPAGHAVDTGFIVYNERNYPDLAALFRELGVATAPSDMSFGVSIGDGRIEWAGDGGLSRLFAQPRNLVSAGHLGMLRDILGFNRRCRRLLGRPHLPDGTLGEFLDAHGYGGPFRTRYLLPMAAAIWSCSTRQALAFPFASFVRFFDAHGLLDVLTGPPWRFVRGGSHSYVRRLLADFSGELRLGCAVTAVRRAGNAAWVAAGGGEERFDAVVSAAHPDQALRLLADADAGERRVLGAIPYARNEMVLHTDVSLMPRRRRAWASWNYLGAQDAVGDGPVPVSYWMNRLQAIPGPVQYIATLNPPRPPDPETVLYRTEYEHPQFSLAALQAQRRLPQIQGARHVWFCGAWTGYGFHEDGLASALAVAEAFGCPAPWRHAQRPAASVRPAIVAEVEPS